MLTQFLVRLFLFYIADSDYLISVALQTKAHVEAQQALQAGDLQH